MKPIQHPSERSFDFAPPQTGRERIEAHTRCHFLGIGESNSKSSTVDSRTASTDESLAANFSGSVGGTAVADQAIAPNLSGSAASKANVNGLQITDVGGAVSITTSDADIVGAALDAVTDLANRTQGNISDLASGAVGSVSQLAATRLTGGETDRDKTILYFGVAALAALAYLATRK